jgi:methylated-DNA-[protein]-cysteine S-methyltransferase
VAGVETRYAVPGWGVGEIWLEDGVLLAHDFHFETGGDAGAGAGLLSAAPLEGAHGPPTGTVAADSSHRGNGSVPRRRQSSTQPATGLVERFRVFLAGDAVDFDDVDLDLEWATPLQRALARTLRGVPRGEVVSYGELAALAGRPGAARAAGAFCAANRFAFVLPCHRVVAAHGLGGYGAAGLEVKRRLLALEKVVL